MNIYIGYIYIYIHGETTFIEMHFPFLHPPDRTCTPGPRPGVQVFSTINGVLRHVLAFQIQCGSVSLGPGRRRTRLTW